MFLQRAIRQSEDSDLAAAIDRSQAVLEFSLDGIIRKANPNFLQIWGYELDDIRGRHHSMFVTEDYARSPEYTQFWAALRRGEFQRGQFKRSMD